MYRAKTDESGMQFYRPELRSMMLEQMRLEQDMRQALEHHEFHLHYQPVYSLMTGEMVGAEALSRWRHFTRGVVAASEFIALAERSGLIRSLDRWAIARAIHQRKTMLDGDWVGWVAVNLSPQSITDPDLPAYIRETLDAAHLAPGSLVLELPEGAVVKDAAAAADFMWELKNTGAAIALDDFGVGAASFAQLKRLPIDILKLSHEFVRGIGGDDGDEHLVEATISIAHGIRAKVLAKGVEQDNQVEWLRDAGCDFIQGYLMGAPMSAEDLSQDLDRTEARG
jgi:EAL domain-containing protein (putative c-di-GMP-specific phosphodiesterase class I)